MAKKRTSRRRSGPSFSVDRPSTKKKKKAGTRSTSSEELSVKQVKFTVELPEITRRSLKAKAAMEGISMREFLLQTLRDAGVDVP